jgi:hypothetical protein
MEVRLSSFGADPVEKESFAGLNCTLKMLDSSIPLNPVARTPFNTLLVPEAVTEAGAIVILLNTSRYAVSNASICL